MAEFDKQAENYEAWHQELISASGFGIDYFYEYKIKEMHRVLAKRGVGMPSTILDFGCGIGNVDPYIRKYFPDAHIYGVDVSEESIKIAKEKQRESGVSYAALHADWQSVDQLSQFGVPFDLVFISNVFHHAPKEEHGGMLAQIAAHMNPGAFLFVFELNPYNPASRIVFNKFDRPVDKNANLIYPYYLKNQVKQSGLRVLRCNYTVFFPKQLGVCIPLEKYMTRFPLGAHYYIMAEKEDLHG